MSSSSATRPGASCASAMAWCASQTPKDSRRRCHSGVASRISRASGLALRKKYCQGFNFELQAAATEEGIILSLGSQHSFPLEEVFRYLHPTTVRDTLEQALLQSPIFETRWRWSTTLALAVPRNRAGA